jgi:hypothetical protein
VSKNHKVVRFDSIAEHAKAALAGKESFEKKQGFRPASDQEGSWSGESRNLEHAVELATKGWRRGGSRVAGAAASVMPRLRQIIEFAPEMVPSHHGMMWDMGAFVNGDPEPFFDEIIDERQTQKYIVTVLIGTAYSSRVDPEEVTYRGGLVLAALDILAMLGYETEVWAEASIRASSPDDSGAPPSMSILTRVKRAGDPADVQSYAFVAEPGWLRRLVFGVMEGFDDKTRKLFGIGGGGYGSALEVTQSKALGAHLVFNLGDHVNWPSQHADDDQRAEWVAKIVGNINDRIVV